MAVEWQEWEVPPFSHYISEHDQFLCRDACVNISWITEVACVPVAAHINLVFDSLIRYNAKMVNPAVDTVT